MKRILMMGLALVVIGGATEMYAQFFDRLGEAARRAAENAVERNIEKHMDELEAQYMQLGGMASPPQTATWNTIDAYIDITNEALSIPNE